MDSTKTAKIYSPGAGHLCPQCSNYGFHVLESRFSVKKNFLKRRRKGCNLCGFKMTTYEIDANDYREFLENKKVIAQLRKEIASARSCHLCVHYYSGACRLEIPELDANECSYFTPDRKLNPLNTRPRITTNITT
jgi:hypothetical protein